MTSRQQQFDEKRAEGEAAKVAAKELDEVNRAVEHNSSAANKQDQEKPGVIGSMLKAVQNTYENAKGAVVGKKDHPATNREEVVDVIGGVEEDVTGEVRDISATKSHPAYDSSATDRAGSKVGEYTDYAAQKTKETKDPAQQKAGEYAGYAGEKAKEAKDKTVEKAGEYKDYAAEKAKEGKDSAADAAKREKKDETKQKTAETAEAAKNKTAETAEAAKNKTAETAEAAKNKTAESAVAAKDSATDAAKRAMGYLGEKKEETKQRTAETAEAAKNKTAETTEAAKQKTSEAMNRTKENLSVADEEARRKIGDLTLQDKGYNKRDESGERSGKVEIKVEETRPGKVAEALKKADQMTGQTFNDVGRMDDEGVIKKDELLDRKY